MQSDSASFDLVVQGGRVFDPMTGRDNPVDIGIKYGRIAAIAHGIQINTPGLLPTGELRTQVLEAEGKIVVPGFIDLHTHVFAGVCPLAIPADAVASRSGVTTMVSAGDTGAYSMDGFRHLIVDRTRTRVLAFLHISRTGLVTWPKGEALDIESCDVDLAIRAVEENRDLIVGIKVRASTDIVGENGLEPLNLALLVGNETELPVMCHVGNTPTGLNEVLDLLRPGDIVTHCFTGTANGLLSDGHVIQAAHRAFERGVLFDVGHGIGSFDFSIAERALDEGLPPTTISTDLNSLSIAGTVKDLPTAMSKFLALGLSLEDTLKCVTIAPASAMGRSDELGSIAVGRTADLTILDVLSGDFSFTDKYSNKRTGTKRLQVHSTIRGGVPWQGPLPHPSRSFAGALE